MVLIWAMLTLAVYPLIAECSRRGPACAKRFYYGGTDFKVMDYTHHQII